MALTISEKAAYEASISDLLDQHFRGLKEFQELYARQEKEIAELKERLRKYEEV